MEVTYCGFRNGVVKLENDAGYAIAVPLGRLSEGDQGFVRALAAKAEREGAK